MKLRHIGVRAHDLLGNAPRGYCLIEAEFESFEEDGRPISTIVQGEKNPYSHGRFRWGKIDPATKLQTDPFEAPKQLTGLAEALKALFDGIQS